MFLLIMETLKVFAPFWCKGFIKVWSRKAFGFGTQAKFMQSFKKN